MDKTNHAIQLLSDAIGDLICDENISPHEIVGAIREELNGLLEYHHQSAVKIERVLSLLRETEETTFKKTVNDAYEDTQDKITFGDYNFKLASEFLNQDDVDWQNYINSKNNNKYD